MKPTHFAFVVDAPGQALDQADIIIEAPNESEAERLAAIRSTIYKAPLRRAVRRDVPIVARCSCGATYTEAQWTALSRRPWVFPDEELEIAECTARHATRERCNSTISISIKKIAVSA